MGGFEAFYDGALQHPWLLWAAALLGGAYGATRPGLAGSARRYLALLTGLSLADAWLTSSHVYGLGALGAPFASAVPLCFVLAGDFRFLLLLGAATPDGRIAPDARGLLAAAALTALVPVASQLVLFALPDTLGGPRTLYLVYELLFVALTLCLLRAHPRMARVPWLARVGRFVLVYYALWASADVLILAGLREAGFALRVVPNALYYGGLMAAIGRAAAERPTQSDPDDTASTTTTMRSAT